MLIRFLGAGLTIESDSGNANAMSACLLADGALQVHDQITIPYHTAINDPYMTFMTFGFVPDEWRGEVQTWPILSSGSDSESEEN